MSQALPSPANCCSPCDEAIVTEIPGPAGADGADGAAGADGQNSFTELTAQFTQPNVAATAVATVVSSDWCVVGQVVYLEGAGYLTVTATADSTHVTLRNLGYTGNASPGAVIAIGAHLGPGGIKGTDGSSATGDMLYADNLNAMADNDTSLANLGGGDVGISAFKTSGVSAVRFFKVLAGNTVSLRTDAEMRTDLGLAIGTNVQAYDADLTTWAGVTPSANGQSLVSAANYAAMRTLLEVSRLDYALYQHQQASGVDGGDFTSGAWRTVPLTTEVYDPSSIGTIAANEVTLGAGTYRVRGWSNAYNVTNAQMRLYNNTLTSVIAYGRCAISSGASTQLMMVEARFTLGSACAIRLEAQCSVTAAGDGFGKALSFGGTEVYAGLEILRE